MVQATSETKEITPFRAVYDVVVHAAAAWDRTLAALDHVGETEGAQRASARCAAIQAREHLDRITAIIVTASEAMEACVTSGRGKEARVWIDALAEMWRVSDAVGPAVRLAHGNSSAPWLPEPASWMQETKAGEQT